MQWWIQIENRAFLTQILPGFFLFVKRGNNFHINAITEQKWSGFSSKTSIGKLRACSSFRHSTLLQFYRCTVRISATIRYHLGPVKLCRSLARKCTRSKLEAEAGIKDVGNGCWRSSYVCICSSQQGGLHAFIVKSNKM